MIPKKPAPESIRGGNRFSEKTMLKPDTQSVTRSTRSDHGLAAVHMPPDARQSKCLPAAKACVPMILRKFAAIANRHVPGRLSATMRTRCQLILALFIGLFIPGAAGALAIAATAAAADGSALAFVTDIYNGYKGKDSRGRALDGEAVIRRYFEPSLAALMIKDQKLAAKRGEVGALDFDPFVDAQDWDISAFDIAVADTAPGRAGATVKFTNLGKPSTVLLDLVAVKNEWRIRDITWQTDGKQRTVRGVYAH
jgi:Protein of unknown function (DUF3828)